MTIVRGDVWLLGNHRLMCGDSTDIKNVGRLNCDVIIKWWEDFTGSVAVKEA